MKRINFLYSIIFFTCFFFFISASFAQKKKKKAIISAEQAMDTIDSYSSSDLFHFPNVNKSLYFQDKKAQKKILEYDKKKNWEALYPVLREYISDFGVVNFYRDTYWIWRLAKITELYGNYEEAKLLYKLVLKHHREDININKVELHYDSLTANDKDYYVPLEYYYELVDYRREVDTLRPPRGVLLNMGNFINSKESDYGPTLSANDDMLIFTSKRNSHNRGIDKVNDEDIFFSRKELNNWGDIEEFEHVNTKYNEGSACLSKDGNTLYFSRCDAPDCYGDCDIFVAEIQPDSTWGNIHNLGININSTAWDSHPSLSHNEDTLYFASDRIGGFGLSDIYYSIKNKEGVWEKALNSGPIINTRNNEVSPFYHHVFDVLYFSSNGQNLNFGEFDIYKSYWEDDSWGEPQNIGPLVNGPGSEFYFAIDSQSKDLYYARSAENSMDNLDLFSFPLPMEAQPGATTTFKGSLSDEKTGEPFDGIVSVIDLDNGIEVAPKFLRPDGSFEFELINNNNYLLIIQGEEFFRIEELFHLDGEMEMKKITSPISSKLKFESVAFENGKSNLSSEMYSDLDMLANFMLDNPNFKLSIAGHTDSDGREEFNLQLSQERAEAIMEYLVFFGNVSEDRINAKGYGSSKPIVEEITEQDKKLNRRVEFNLFTEEN
ncbi:MAG: OmpA family protein [Cyclobacteriaceae bacterium]|nr:OmpA family protein [Cyclobacteriaceae bacterium]